jgi:hypothetical protein
MSQLQTRFLCRDIAPPASAAARHKGRSGFLAQLPATPFLYTSAMAGVCATTFRICPTWLCAVSLLAGWSASALVAQEPPQSVRSEEPFTLHVYADLIQIPVLVLGPNRERLVQPIAPGKFSVSIDSGPWFRAAHVRREGDDPISLAILFDINGNVPDLMPRIDKAIADLAPLSLHPADRISIYALNCKLVRTPIVPAGPEDLKRTVDSALSSWMANKASHAKCEQPIPLRNTLMFMLKALHDQPGRRVILAITEGEDKLSKTSWRDVTENAKVTGTAIFGIVPQPSAPAGVIGVGGAVRWQTMSPGYGVEPAFDSLCQLSGGTILGATADHIGRALTGFTTMLRERYIVDFPRPANSTAGGHDIEVRVEKSTDFIRPSGISFTIPDPAVLADPTTVPSDSSLAPVQGQRHELPQPH